MGRAATDRTHGHGDGDGRSHEIFKASCPRVLSVLEIQKHGQEDPRRSQIPLSLNFAVWPRTGPVLDTPLGGYALFLACTTLS